MPTPVYVLNLPGEEESFSAVKAQLQNIPGFEIARVPAVLGHALPDKACLWLTRDLNSLNNKGALGCFLTHIRAWERIAASSNRYGIVLEDDVICADLKRLITAALPEDFDIVFCNDRTALPNTSITPSQEMLFFDIAGSVPVIAKRGKSVGGDGYLLTPKAAGRLIDLVQYDRFFSHVDLRLLAYCLDRERLDQSGPVSALTNDLRSICEVTKRGRVLVGYSASPAPVIHKAMASRRMREDELGKGAAVLSK